MAKIYNKRNSKASEQKEIMDILQKQKQKLGRLPSATNVFPLTTNVSFFKNVNI